MNQKPAFVRKHFFINRELQGRYMLSFLIPMVVLLIFMLFTLYIASQAIINTTTRIIKRDIESRIALELQDQANPSVQQYESVIAGVSQYIRSFSTNKEFKKDLLSSLMWVFGIGILLVMIQLVLLTIFFSHKVAGPVYRFERVCHNIIEGKYTDEVKLRKGDQMMHLADLLNQAVKVTRQRFQELTEGSEEKRKETSSSLKI